MPTTPLLGINQVTASQNNKEVTINDAIEALENATNANLAVDFSAASSVLLSDTQATRNFIFTATGATADSTLSFPAAVNGTPYERALVVRNLSGFALTVEITGAPGATVIVPNNEARLLATINGTDIIVAAEPQSTVSFVSLNDTPASLTGQQGRFLTVNVAEDALEFADAAVFPSYTNNAGKYLVVNGTEDGVEWVDLSVVTTFLDLTDGPSSYTGQAGKLVAVNDTADGVEFIDVPEAEAVEFTTAQRWRVRVVDFNIETQVGFGEIEMLDVDGINLTGSGTASASTSDTGNGPEFAFDGTTAVGQGWLSEDGFVGTVWIEYDFGTTVTVRSMRLSPINGFPTYTPLRFVMEAFVDGAWLPLGDRTVTAWVDNVPQTFKINGVPLSSVADAPSDNQPYFRRNGGWEAPDTDGTLAANSDETIASQRAVKTYVDTKLNARSWKDPVVAATTAAVTLATDLENGDTIDGVVLATNDRILVKDQAAPAENGIYIVAASGAPTRAPDSDSSAELVGAAVVVSEGTANGDKQFLCTTDSPIVVDTDPIAFAVIEGGGGGSLAVEDDGLEILAAATRLNFTGAGVTITDAGSGEAEIAIPGGGGGGGAVSSSYCIIEHTEALNTDGGTLTSGAWETRPLNTEVADTIGVTLAANVITLPAGTYFVRGAVPFLRTNECIARLFDVTNTATLLYGTAGFSDSGTDGSGDYSLFYGIISLASATDIRLESQVLTTAASFGGGNANGFGDVEHYSRLEFVLLDTALGQTVTQAGTVANLLNTNSSKYQRWTNAAAKTLTVQPNATEAIDQDAEFYIANRAATGNLTLVEGAGVTINPPSGGGLVLAPGMAATLKRVTIDEYDLLGQTTA